MTGRRSAHQTDAARELVMRAGCADLAKVNCVTGDTSLPRWIREQ